MYNLALLNTEQDIVHKMDFTDIIDLFTVATRSSADADNGLDAFSGQSRSTNILGPLRLFAKHVIGTTHYR